MSHDVSDVNVLRRAFRGIANSLWRDVRPPPEDQKLRESAWRRAGRLWEAICLSLPFLGANGIASILVGRSNVLLGLAVFFGLLVIAFLWAGLYALVRQRDEARAEIRLRDKSKETDKHFQRLCFDWADRVDKFLEVRNAIKPSRPVRGLANFARYQARPKTDEEIARDRECEKIDRETVSLYLDQHRDQGVVLFTTLIELGCIVDKGLPDVRSPNTVHDIGIAANLMRTGADRLVGRF